MCPNPRLGSWDFTLPLMPPFHPSTNTAGVSKPLYQILQRQIKVTLEAKDTNAQEKATSDYIQISSPILPSPASYLKSCESKELHRSLHVSIKKNQVLIYIGVQLIYNTLLILVVWEINFLIHTHVPIVSQILFSYRILQTIEQNSFAVQQVFVDYLLNIVVYIY